jgi:hypothetical protein
MAAAFSLGSDQEVICVRLTQSYTRSFQGRVVDIRLSDIQLCPSCTGKNRITDLLRD